MFGFLPMSVRPFLVMLVAPAFFSTNIIFGRHVAPETDPFVLAFLRWGAVALILMPFALATGAVAMRATLARQGPFLVLLGILGMLICGGAVYRALQLTTATNATLIYTTSSVLIILVEQLFFGRQAKRREWIGAVLAFTGVSVIVLKGDIDNLLALTFNWGDLIIAVAALSWAFYSILYRSPRVNHLANIELFSIVALFGALANLPLAIPHLVDGSGLPQTANGWLSVAGIIAISSLLAFLSFQYGVRSLGASVAGLFMYLMTPYGVLMAVVFLGESLHPFHGWGIALVMSGVILATIPDRFLKRTA